MAKIIDNYILLEGIGQGSFGEVHKGRNLISKEAVAVKTIKLDRFLNDTQLRDMIINEIQALKKLEDQYIVRMIKMLKSANNIYLVYEFLNGGSLAKMLEEKGPIPEKDALTILFGVFKYSHFVNNRGFKTLIQEKIIHRNMNPGNLFFNDGVVKVKNFFCCKSPVSQKNFQPESISYCAPEILMKQSNEDKSDMFSLGLIFHKMVFGCLPIDEAWGQDELTDFYRHSKKDGFKVQGLSDFSTNLIESMLMFDPLRRMEWEMLFLQTEETSKGEFTATTSHSASTNFETLGQNFYISQQSHNFSTQQQVQSVQQDVLKRRTTNTSQLTEFSTKVTSSTQNLRISGKENMDQSQQSDKYFAKTMDKEVPLVPQMTIPSIIAQIAELRKGFLVNLQSITKIFDLVSWQSKIKPEVCTLLLLKKAIKACQDCIDFADCPDSEYDRRWDSARQKKELLSLLRKDQDDLIRQFWRLQQQTELHHQELQTLEIQDVDYINETLGQISKAVCLDFQRSNGRSSSQTHHPLQPIHHPNVLISAN